MDFYKIVSTLMVFIISTQAAYGWLQGLMVDSSNQFSFQLYKEIGSQEFSRNVIHSPFLIHKALAALTFGAREQTFAEIAFAIELPHYKGVMEITKLGYANILDEISSVENVTLEVVSNLFVAKALGVYTDYNDLIQTYFQTKVDHLNAYPEESVNTINEWVGKKTRGKITNLLANGDIDDSTQFIFLNAIYFKAKWNFKFDKKDTAPGIFYNIYGKPERVSVMYAHSMFNYGIIKELNAEYIELPYENTNYKMIIIIPNTYYGLFKLEKSISSNLLDLYVSKYVSLKEVKLYLPKFKIESTIDLENYLKKLGMKSMFKDSADFSGMVAEPVYISKFIEKAYISVDEEGSEAAAVSGTIATHRSLFDPSVYLRIDRPFYFAIMSSSLKLFEGHVINPKFQYE